MIRTFLKGLFALLPLTITIYAVFWAFTTVEAIADRLLFKHLNFALKIPGLGILTTFAAIYLLGKALEFVPVSRMFGAIQQPLKNIPLVKSIYTAVEDLMFFFNNGNSTQGSRVVKVKLPGQDVEMVGLLTRSDVSKITGIDFQQGKVAVYFPMSYQLGGFTLFLDQQHVTLTDMSVESAMKSALTGWIKKEEAPK